MNYFISTLIKLSENDKRVLIALCLLVLVIIVIVGYLTIWVKKIKIGRADNDKPREKS